MSGIAPRTRNVIDVKKMIPRKSNNWSVGREVCRERNILTVLILPPQSRHLLVKEGDTGYEMLEIH